MKPNHALHLIAATLLGVFATATMAQDSDSYYYLGGGVGQSRSKIHVDRVAAGVLGAGISAPAFERDDRDTGYKLFGGYQFNPYFGLEGGYFSLGRFAFNSTLVPPGTLAGQMKIMGLDVDAVGTWPMTPSFALLGRVGAQYAKVRDTFSGTGSAAGIAGNPSKRALNFKLGLGLQYEITRSVLLRGEVEHFRVTGPVSGHNGVNMISASLVFPIGRVAAAAPRAAIPAYVAPAPAPAMVQAPAPVAPPPVVVLAPPARPAPPVLKTVTFSAESLFTFDNSAVTAQGKTALDGFAAETKGLQYEQISVEGHADRLGSTAYNQKLSLQRADAVKSYLVSAGHVDASRISTVGRSESAPVTHPGDCVGNVATQKLIKCLQPDRRVEIQVIGKN
jgi:OOP family OmpA-OmpF porin